MLNVHENECNRNFPGQRGKDGALTRLLALSTTPVRRPHTLTFIQLQDELITENRLAVGLGNAKIKSAFHSVEKFARSYFQDPQAQKPPGEALNRNCSVKEISSGCYTLLLFFCLTSAGAVAMSCPCLPLTASIPDSGRCPVSSTRDTIKQYKAPFGRPRYRSVPLGSGICRSSTEDYSEYHTMGIKNNWVPGPDRKVEEIRMEGALPDGFDGTIQDCQLPHCIMTAPHRLFGPFH